MARENVDGPSALIVFFRTLLVVEDDIEEGTVHVQPTVVIDEAQFMELIHEETDTGARGADHLGEHFLTDLWNDRLRLTFFPILGQQQKDSRQLLLGRIEEMIN